MSRVYTVHTERRRAEYTDRRQKIRVYRQKYSGRVYRQKVGEQRRQPATRGTEKIKARIGSEQTNKGRGGVWTDSRLRGRVDKQCEVD